MDGAEKPKRKRRTPEEIEADKAAKEQRRIEREAKRAEKEAEKERKEKERAEKKEKRRLQYGPWTEEERIEKAKEWINNLYPSEAVLKRWDRSNECSVTGDIGEYCDGETVGSTGEVYKTSLTSCTCMDFRYHRAQCCKHQIALARHICGDVVPKPVSRFTEWASSNDGRASIKEDRDSVDEMVKQAMEAKETERKQLEKKKKRRIIIIILIIIALVIFFML